MNKPQAFSYVLVKHWGIVLGLTVAYIFSLPFLYRNFGINAVLAGILPATAAGWFLGRRGGLAISLTIVASSMIVWLGSPSRVNVRFTDLWPDFILIIVTAFVAGIVHKSMVERDLAEARLRQQLQQAQTLSAISRTLSETERIGLEHVLQLIVDSARKLIPGTDRAVIHLLNREQELLEPKAVSGYASQVNSQLKMRLGEGVAGQVIAEGKIINITDTQTDQRFRSEEQPVRFRSIVVAPIQRGDERVGTISAMSDHPNTFNEDKQRLLSALGAQAAIAIENTRLLETTQQSLKEVNALYHITRGLAVSLDTGQLMKEVVDLLQKNFGYYEVQIFVIDPETEELIMQTGSGKAGEELIGRRMPAGAGIVGHAVETGKPFFTNDVDKVVFFINHPLLPDTHSELAVPIKADGSVLGVLDIQCAPPARITENDLQLVTSVADQLAVALQKANLYAELQSALEQEKSTRQQLLQSDRLALVGRLLASVSHELNNPLQAIQNALFLLKEEHGISAQGQQDLNIILSEAERMAGLIDRLRTSYRSTRVEDFQAVQVNELVEDIHTLVATHLRHNKIALEFHPGQDIPPAYGLPDQIKQVILNLMMNAVEAMNNGGRLIIATHMDGENEICLTVTDTGPGVDPDILPNIFDAFVTNKESGTGLGLTITYDIIQRHNGRITAFNAKEGGACFTVWLPIYKKEST